MTPEQQKIADEALEEIKGNILSEMQSIERMCELTGVKKPVEVISYQTWKQALEMVKDAEHAIERGSWK